VTQAGPADAAVLSLVIADAFHDLPPAHWLIADPRARRKIFPAYFRIFVDHAMAAGIVHTTTDRAGVALWLSVSTDGPRTPGDDYDDRLAEVTGPWTRRFQAFDAELDRRHPTRTAHHHLAMLAVHPDRQGQGIGTALLRAHHVSLDQTGTPAYLEASSPRNRALYLSHGYAGPGPFHLPDGGPPMWPMTRSAAWALPKRQTTRQ
jgi:ribosomal protein S18 acetylase RimI-like enzyme